MLMANRFESQKKLALRIRYVMFIMPLVEQKVCFMYAPYFYEFTIGGKLVKVLRRHNATCRRLRWEKKNYLLYNY